MGIAKIRNKKSNRGVKLLIGGFLLVFGLATLNQSVGFLFILLAFLEFTYDSGVEVDLDSQ